MISIIVPVYNAEKYIRKCIESVLHQTYPVWEMILIDNGSDDDSFKICQEYARKDERIYTLHQYQNKGVSAARNLGVEKASGKYITFLDADDWVAEDYLEQLVKITKNTNADILVCQYKKVYEEQRNDEKEVSAEDFKEGQNFDVKEYDGENFIEKCLLEGCTHCWGVLYKATVLEGIYFPEKIAIGEDALFLIDAVLQAEKIVVTEYDGYRYYINENGAMNCKFTHSYMDQIRCWKKAKEKLVETYPAVENKINSILMVSTMLVVGKLSALSEEELKGFQKEVEECRSVIQEYGGNWKVMKMLPSGYALKVMIFKLSPALYMKLYGAWKNK